MQTCVTDAWTVNMMSLCCVCFAGTMWWKGLRTAPMKVSK